MFNVKNMVGCLFILELKLLIILQNSVINTNNVTAILLQIKLPIKIFFAMN